MAKAEKKESRRVRKKREWLERKEKIARGGGDSRRSGVVSSFSDNGDQEADFDEDDWGWKYLPDLVLEIIFQMLPLEVRN